MGATGLTGKTITETLAGKGWAKTDGAPQLVSVGGQAIIEPGKWSETRAAKRIPAADIFPQGAILFIEGEMAGTVVWAGNRIWLDIDGEKTDLIYMLDAETMDTVRIAG